MEIQNIIDIVCKERIHDPQSLAGGGVPRDGESFTTGDIDLDSALGGGVRTGMVWEIVGQRYCRIAFHESLNPITYFAVPPERHSLAYSYL